MTTSVIPAQTIVICDRCRVECKSTNRVRGGRVDVKGLALDSLGHAVGSADRRYDLCDPCMYVVTAAIEAALRTSGG